MTEVTKKIKIDRTLSEMILGILAFGAICQLTVFWFIPQKGCFAAGLWIGITAACAYAWHLWWSLDRNMTVNADNERGATAFSLKQSVLRYAGVALVLIGLWYLGGNTSMLAGFLGVMGVKIGAYLQPLIGRSLGHRD